MVGRRCSAASRDGCFRWCDMGEKPILFSGEMVRAILDGRKTQTRRVVKPQPVRAGWNEGHFEKGAYWRDWPYMCPYGHPGDRLWVRETWQRVEAVDGCGIVYRADERILAVDYDGEFRENERLRVPFVELKDFIDEEMLWLPSIHMPRWACRIALEIVAVRLERLQEITEEDARAEGVVWQRDFGNGLEARDARPVFVQLWASINGVASWNENPWVWVVEFRRLL